MTIQRDGDYVLWDEWRNPDEDEVDLPAWPWEPHQVNVFLFHPSRSAIREDRPWLQFRKILAVSSDDPADQAERLAEQLVAADPRQAAEVCGGSPDFTRQLGYSWPQLRRA
ncbi:hypothetical protein ACFWD7_46560 [Streptomyces mirabilis]|uniref:hypothetical protein n=1 Tax=Streptomyces mirabilis TaxID=68239 RepID=UPI0036CC94E0